MNAMRLSVFSLAVGLLASVMAADRKGGSSAWTSISPAEAGYDAVKLSKVPEFIRKNAGTTGLMVVVGGRVLFEYGDVKEVSYIASCRKSVLAMLYGIADGRGRIDLKKTVGDLGIDDIGGLLPLERTATVEDLLTARSGVYHAAANAGGITPDKAPKRGTVKPGTRFAYNNWDFNAAGTAFEMMTGTGIYEAFARDLVRPLGLQDYDPKRHVKTGDATKSRHLAYHFHLSTRDMARLGELMLRQGRWDGEELISADWIKRSVTAYSRKSDGFGYGYLWWIWPEGTVHPEAYRGAFSAQGKYGQFITILPALDMVVAHKSARNAKGPTKKETYRQILDLIIAARTTGKNGGI